MGVFPRLTFKTYERKPWFIVAASQVYPEHETVGHGNDDAFIVDGSGVTTWLIVADGMSSAPYGARGARLAAKTLSQYLVAALATSQPSRTTLIDGYKAAHAALVSHARDNALTTDDLATTLVATLIHPHGIYTANIGDGPLVYWAHAVGDAIPLCGTVLPPQSPNQTTTPTYGIHQDDWYRMARFRDAFPLHAVRALLVASDGAAPSLKPTKLKGMESFSSPLASLPSDLAKLGKPNNFAARFLNVFNACNARIDDCTMIYAIRTDLPPPTSATLV